MHLMELSIHILCIVNHSGNCTERNEKSISDSFRIERNMIVMTILLLTMIQMVHNQKEISPYVHIPLNLKGN